MGGKSPSCQLRWPKEKPLEKPERQRHHVYKWVSDRESLSMWNKQPLHIWLSVSRGSAHCHIWMQTNSHTPAAVQSWSVRKKSFSLASCGHLNTTLVNLYRLILDLLSLWLESLLSDVKPMHSFPLTCVVPTASSSSLRRTWTSFMCAFHCFYLSDQVLSACHSISFF